MIVPVIRYDEAKASAAYLAHIALLAQERADPTLKDNPAWTILRQDAFEMFMNAYEAVP